MSSIGWRGIFHWSDTFIPGNPIGPSHYLCYKCTGCGRHGCTSRRDTACATAQACSCCNNPSKRGVASNGKPYCKGI